MKTTVELPDELARRAREHARAHGLYTYEMATYDADDQFDQTLAEGFVKLWGLPLKTWAAKVQAQGEEV